MVLIVSSEYCERVLCDVVIHCGGCYVMPHTCVLL